MVTSSTDGEHTVASTPLTPGDATALMRALRPHVPESTLRSLLYITAPDASGAQMCRLTAVLDAGGVLIAHAVTRDTPTGPHLAESAPASAPEPTTETVILPDPDHAWSTSFLVPRSALPESVVRAVDRLPDLWNVQASASSLAPPSGLEICVDRNGTGYVTSYFEPNVPPEDSGAEYHVWHHSPELDELKEQLDPESWWARLAENIGTKIRWAFSRH